MGCLLVLAHLFIARPLPPEQFISFPQTPQLELIFFNQLADILLKPQNILQMQLLLLLQTHLPPPRLLLELLSLYFKL